MEGSSRKVMTCCSTEVQESMARSEKCQSFSVGGGQRGEGEREDSGDERGVTKTMGFILGTGESRQRLINGDDR